MQALQRSKDALSPLYGYLRLWLMVHPGTGGGVSLQELDVRVAGDRKSQQSASVGLLLLIVFLGGCARLHYLGELSLWFDESFDWKMATFPLSEQWDRVAGDNHPPLYFYLLKPWTLLWGSSPATVRALSVVFGVFTIVGAFALVREVEAAVLGRGIEDSAVSGPGLVAAALIALSPIQIEWSQTARMYAVGACLTVWSTWAFVRLVSAESPRWSDWLLYALLGAGLIYTHYFGLFILAAHGTYGAAQVVWVALGRSCQFPEAKRKAISLILAFGTIALLWLPWLDEFLAQRQRGIEQEWGRPQGWDHLIRSVREMFGLMWSPASAGKATAWVITSVFAVSAVGALLFSRRIERVLALGVVMTFAFALAFSTGARTVIASWYFLFAHTLFLCVVAIWLWRVPRGVMQCVALGVVLSAASWQCYQQLEWRAARAQRPSFQGAIAYVESVRGPEEPIFVTGPRDLVACSPYIEHPNSLFILSQRRDFRFGEGTSVVDPHEYAEFEWVAALPIARAWVVFATNGASNPAGVEMPSEWIDVAEERFDDWRYTQIIVRQYERRDAVRALLKSRSHLRDTGQSGVSAVPVNSQ